MMPDNNKVTELRTPPASNLSHLQRIFGNGVWVWSNNSMRDPGLLDARDLANRHFAELPTIHATAAEKCNTYYCISTFHSTGVGEHGQPTFDKQVKNWSAMYLAVIDDVGTKGMPLAEVKKRLMPSYVIETSPGNYQVGYVLRVPLTVKVRAKHLMNSLNSEAGDSGAQGINRVIRLPYGVNNKTKYVEALGVPFKVKYESYTGTRYTPEEIEEAFDIPYKPAPPPQDAVVPATVGEHYQPTLEEFANALTFIDPAHLDRDGDSSKEEIDLGWLDFCMIARFEYGDAARPVMEEWSARDVDRYNRQPGDFAERWNGYKVKGDGSYSEGDKPRGMGSFISYYQNILCLDPPWMAEQEEKKQELSLVMSGMMLGVGNVPRANITNAMIAISLMPDIHFTFDTFRDRDYLNGAVVEDKHITQTRLRMEPILNNSVNGTLAADAMMYAAKHNQFDSLNDYIEALPDRKEGDPDHISRLAEELQLVIPIEFIFLRRHLIGSIARAVKPGCKMDTALILYGGQGKQKSSFIEALCPDIEWFDDSVSGQLNNKDELSKLAGRWHIELAELSSMTRSNVKICKQFMSTKVDRYRSAYARKVEDHPRRCAIWGSTNEDDSNSDETGNRRYWHIDVKDHKGQATDWLRGETDGISNRDLLWAQAKALYQQGEQWWLTEEEEGDHVHVAEHHRKKGVVEQHLEEWWDDSASLFRRGTTTGDMDWIEYRAVRDEGRHHFVSTAQVAFVLKDKMRLPPSPYDIAKALRLLGWTAYPTRTEEQERQFKKATTLQFKHNGQRVTAPKGFASPELHAVLETMSKSNQARAILGEASVSTVLL